MASQLSVADSEVNSRDANLPVGLTNSENGKLEGRLRLRAGVDSGSSSRFQVADLSRAQIPRRPLARLRFQCGNLFVLGHEVDQFSPMCGDKMAD